MKEGRVGNGSVTPLATRRSLAVVVALGVAGIIDYVALNVVVWPRCVDRLGAQHVLVTVPHELEPIATLPLPSPRDLGSAGGGRSPAKARSEPLTGADRSLDVERPEAEEMNPMAPPTIGDILFDTRSAALSRRAMQLLDEVVDHMLEDRATRVLLRGHADDRGDQTANLGLSRQRALAAVGYVRRRGISLNRIAYEGVGEREPVDLSGTPSARAKNRRVEVVWRDAR